MKEVQVIRPTIGINADRTLRVAAYCRVSTDSDDQINSFIAQVKYYNDFIRRSRNMTLVDIYADEGITGTCVNKRDEFLRMMSDSRKGKIDRILVKSVSRFARNSLECIENIRLLKSYGTTVLFENDGIDTDKMNSEMILYIKSAFAQNEALATSKRVTTAVQMRMRNGEYSIYTVPFGFRAENNTLIPVPEHIPIIKKIYTDYLSGKGMGRIAEDLNKQQCTDRIWNVSAIRYILSNEKYVGDSLLQKTYTPQVFPLRNRPNYGEADRYYVMNTHEGIVDRALFEKVKAKLDGNTLDKSKSQARQKSVFSKLIKCGDCGWTYKMKINSGEIYWVCSKTGVAGAKCNTPNIKEEDLKKLFIRMYNKLRVHETEIVDRTISQLTAAKTKISGMNDEISEIDAEIAKLCEQNSMYSTLKMRNIIDDVSFIEKTSEIQRKITALRNKRIQVINSDDDEKVIEELRKLKSYFAEYPKALIRFDEHIFSDIIKAIYVSSDNAVQFELVSGLKLGVKI